MDIEELTAALGDPDHAPEPDVIMATFTRKRRRRARQRWSAAGGALAAAAAVVAAVVLLPRTAPAPESSASSSRPAIAAPSLSGRGAASGTGSTQHLPAQIAGPSAEACTPMSLAQRVAGAVRSGGSVVIANATASGQETVALRDVRTLRGPRIPSSVTGYVVDNLAHGSLHGQVFAIVVPVAVTGHAGGALMTDRLLTAPVSGGIVQFASAGCWGMTDTPLAAVERLVTANS